MTEPKAPLLYGQAAAMTLASILAEAAKGPGLSVESVTAGALTASAGVLIAKLTARTDHHDTEREVLENALHNGHLARAAAEAVRYTLLRYSDIIKAKSLHIEAGSLRKLANAAEEYWVELLTQDDPRIAAYSEDNLTTRLKEYLDHDPNSPLLLHQWKKILVECTGAKELDLQLTDFQWNALAGHLCREYPCQLYTAIKTDLEHKGAAFGGVVLRMLAALSHSVDELRKQPPPNIDLLPLFSKFAEFTNLVLEEAQSRFDQLDAADKQARDELLAYREEMHTEFNQLHQRHDRHDAVLKELRAGQEDIKNVVALLKDQVAGRRRNGKQSKVNHETDQHLRRMGVLVEWTKEGPKVSGNGVIITPLEWTALFDRYLLGFDALRAQGAVQGAASVGAVIKACEQTYYTIISREDLKELKSEIGKKADLFYRHVTALWAGDTK